MTRALGCCLTKLETSHGASQDAPIVILICAATGSEPAEEIAVILTHAEHATEGATWRT